LARGGSDEEIQNSLYIEIIEQDLNMDASPGVPWMVFGNNNAQLFSTHRRAIWSAVVERLRVLAGRDFRGCSAEELVKAGACDPVRLFVKNEPHNSKKLAEGRVRLISSVSLVDQIVERLLWGRQNAEEMSVWQRIPSKPGFGLTDMDVSTIYESVRHQFAMGPVAMSDMSGWDFSVQAWEFDHEVLMRNGLNGSDYSSLYGRVNANRMYCLSMAVLTLSDGTMIAQRERGMMKSGSYGTSSINSRQRVCAAYFVGADWCMAAGDDAVESFVADAESRYAALGHNLKGYELAKGSVDNFGFEFCSTWMSRGLGYPVDPSRSLFRLLHKRVGDQEALHQWRMEMRNHPDKLRWEGLMLRAGWSAQN
jgi:hypothetical protein